MMTKADRIDVTSPDMKAELLARLKSVVPEAFSDGLLDLDRLAELAGDAVASGPERYGLTWPGKREAIAMLQAPSRATLVPEVGQSVNFDDARHVFIEGENLEVLKLLYKSYFGRVKLIYIDPPYNTGNDFIYHDDFSDPLAAYLRQTGQMNEDGDMTTSAPEKNGRLHSNWLSMMYPRLSMARQMLGDDGVVFISIDEVELSNLVLLMDLVFGDENKIGIVTWKNVTDNNPTLINKDHEFIVCYGRDIKKLPQNWQNHTVEQKDLLNKFYEARSGSMTPSEIENELRQFIRDNFESLGFLTRYKNVDDRGIYTGSESVHNTKAGGYEFEILHPETKKPMNMPANGYRFPKSTFDELVEQKKIIYGSDEKRIIKLKKYVDEFYDTFRSIITIDGRLGTYDIKRIFDTEEALFNNPKPVDLLRRLVSFVTAGNDLCVDMFAGSASLQEAVIAQNQADGSKRRVISMQFPEGIEDGKPAKKLGFNTISQLALERSKKVVEKASGANSGLRAFRLTTTNIRRWAGTKDMTPEGYIKQMDAFADTLLPGWKAEDVIWEVAVREGFPLTATITPSGNAAPKGSWRVSDPDTDRAFTICLADHIDLASVKLLGLAKSDLFVCRDTALDDTIAANLALQCTLKVL
jgi:adenine-specific DNA-methyltransferase